MKLKGYGRTKLKQYAAEIFALRDNYASLAEIAAFLERERGYVTTSSAVGNFLKNPKHGYHPELPRPEGEAFLPPPPPVTDMQTRDPLPLWQFYTAQEIAQYLHVERGTVHQWIREGAPVHRWGHRTFRFEVAPLMEWLEQRGRR